MRAHLAKLGLPPDGYRADNGSGLFDATEVSREAARRRCSPRRTSDYRIGPDLLASLPVGGVDGTLARRWHGQAGARAACARRPARSTRSRRSPATSASTAGTCSRSRSSSTTSPPASGPRCGDGGRHGRRDGRLPRRHVAGVSYVLVAAVADACRGGTNGHKKRSPPWPSSRAARPTRTSRTRSRASRRRTAATSTSPRSPTSRATPTSPACSATPPRARPATRTATSTT